MKGCHQLLQIIEFPRRTILMYSVIVVIGGNEIISSILSEMPTSHSTYPTLPCSVLFAMTTWQRQEEDSFFKCACACYGTKYFDSGNIFDTGILNICDVI